MFLNVRLLTSKLSIGVKDNVDTDLELDIAVFFGLKLNADVMKKFLVFYYHITSIQKCGRGE